MDKLNLLKKYGYVLFPEILSQEQVKIARATLIEIFSQKSSYEGDLTNTPIYGNAYLDCFLRYKQLRWILFNQKMIDALKPLLGEDFVFIPETAIHDSGFGGWHKDTNSQEERGEKFHWEQDFLMVQVGIYLQDNGEYGGGLDVIPGSHDKRNRDGKPDLIERITQWFYRKRLLKNPNKEYTIPSKAGDMIVFNLRLDHKASFPKRKPIPGANRKLAIFMVASVNNRHANNYLKYIQSREDYHYLKNHKYPEELLREASRHSINLIDI